MTLNTQEHTRVDFHCPKVDQDVQIDRIYAIQVSRAGKRMGRTAAETDCSHKDRCGIATQGEAGTVYDWNRCAWVRPQA
ncbi:MAG: hypothetical protein JNK55_00300 [Rubrivivax sp.]|nr:hypothetical protein [Rubrivivax sp.]HRD98881.1 hypothetical protein [Rubrivivax sp.]